MQLGYNRTKNLAFLQFFQQTLQLAFEDMRHQVRTYSCSLAWQQVIHNLLPPWIALLQRHQGSWHDAQLPQHPVDLHACVQLGGQV